MLSSVVYLLDLIRVKIFVSSSSVQPHPFKNFHQTCFLLTISMQKFSSSVHQFDCICAKISFIHTSVWPFRFKWLGYLFLIRVLAARLLAARLLAAHLLAARLLAARSFLRNFHVRGHKYEVAVVERFDWVKHKCTCKSSIK